MHDNQQVIPVGPSFATIFDYVDAGLGVPARRVLVSCAADSANPLDYRLANAPEETYARLQPGEAFALGPYQFPITQIEARGVGGSATGGYEVMS